MSTFEILYCPDGEDCLAKLERIHNLTYKECVTVDDGKSLCTQCDGTGAATNDPFANMQDSTRVSCRSCNDTGQVLIREPSSHKVVRKILSRRERLTGAVLSTLLNTVLKERHVPAAEYPSLSKDIVDLILHEVDKEGTKEDVLEHENITVHFTTPQVSSHLPTVITANLRVWRRILRTQCSPKTPHEMRAVMEPLRDELRARIPIIFDEGF